MSENPFKPAAGFSDRHGVFVALVGGTNSGKTFSAMRLARGIAGPKGKIAVVDTEGGRTLHLKDEFAFDVTLMTAPHRPQRYAEIAKQAETAGYDALVVDSFSAEWAGAGGVLSWADDEATRMAGDDDAKRERVKGATWIKPKAAHKAMVYSLLERRIPIIFSIRGEETFVPPSTKMFKAVCNKAFLFEVTVSFRLKSDDRGAIDLSDPTSYKMEGSHRAIFRDGEQLSERHGELLARWADGSPIAARDPGLPVESGVLPDAFKNAGEFIDWSGRYLAAATPNDAAAWEAKYRDRLGKLKARDPDAVERLMTAFHERATPAGIPAATEDDMFPGDKPSTTGV